MVEGRADAHPSHLVVGHISKPHGIRGEVLIWPLTDAPEERFSVGSELLLGNAEGEPEADGEPEAEGERAAAGEREADAAPDTVVVERTRRYRRGWLVAFRGYADRTAVEPLLRRYLLVPMGRVEPLEEGELYYHQLLGLEVVTAAGESIGRVREVYELEPADLLEVRKSGTAGGGERIRLVPFTREIVKATDLDAGRLVIEPPPGLLEL